MKVTSLTRWGMALCLLGTFAASPARAEPAWSYFWTTTTPLVGSNGAGVSLTPATGSGSASSDIVAANLSVISSAPAETPDQINGNWNLTLHLTDNVSGSSGTLPFSGHFNGTVSATASSVDNTFNEPKIASLSLGTHLYSVTIGLYTPPGLAGTTQQGAIGASLALSDLPGGPPPPPPPPPPPTHNSPEPSSLILSLLAVSSLGLGWWKGRRPRTAALGMA